MRWALVMAGGAGTRLWPMSRGARPKQLLPIFGDKTLLGLAVDRLEALVPPARRLICTAEEHRPQVRALLPDFPDEQILGEPEGRDTANAIGFAAAILAKRDPKAIFAVLTADHVIEPVEALRRTLELGFAVVEDDPRRFVTFSIRATEAATGYGWVRRGAPLAGLAPAARAEAFVEKPDAATAERFLRDPAYGWNSGMFVFAAASFLDALARYLPESHAGLRRIADAWDGSRRSAVLADVFPRLPRKSVDHSVMSGAAKDRAFEVCCVPLDVTWLDVGSWPAYAGTLAPDAEGNRAHGTALHLGSHGVVVVSDDPDHIVATIDCADLIVVRTATATLVCPAKSAQKVKELVARLGAEWR
jgi:mannose-1-phosphate guanylyltransferase